MEEKRRTLNSVILVLLLIVSMSSLYMLYSTNNFFNPVSNEETAEVIEPEESHMFAVMVEQNRGAGDYKEENWSSLTKTGYSYNATLSGCIDGEGKKIANALTYTNGSASIVTDSSAFCYLYFSKN